VKLGRSGCGPNLGIDFLYEVGKRGFGLRKYLYRKNKYYGMARINGWDKNCGFKYIEDIAS
jgi:hypothetical protein